MKRVWSQLFLFVLVISGLGFAAPSDTPSLSLAGKWQFSWEARIGTERGTLELEQTDSNLTGRYQGHIVAPKATGTLVGNKVTLNLDFQRAHPFTIIFTGTVDGDKMSGTFEVKDFKNAYDTHGENVRPSNYTWNAIRIGAQSPATITAQTTPNSAQTSR